MGGIMKLIDDGIILPADYYEKKVALMRQVIFQERQNLEEIQQDLENIVLNETMKNEASKKLVEDDGAYIQHQTDDTREKEEITGQEEQERQDRDSDLEKSKFNQNEQLQGIGYKIIDANGQICYQGGLSKKIKITWWNQDALDRQQRVVKGWIKPYVMEYFPLEQNGHYQGGVFVGYSLYNTSSYPFFNLIAPYINLILIGTPCIVIASVLFIYSRRFVKAIWHPLNELQKGIDNIQKDNLDFVIESTGEDELAKLCLSFEKMRCTLKESLEANWRKEAERKRLMSGLAHDLRTPLTVIEGRTELMLEDILTPEQMKESTLAIRRNTERLIHLVGALNQINKWQQTQVFEEKHEIELDEFIKEKLRDYKVLAIERNIDIQYRNQGIHAELSLNTNAISQILDNLVSNSLRFTPKHGTIEIITQCEQDKLILMVEDSGCGFNEQDYNQATQIFYQGDDSRNSGQHYGIGLYIVDYLVKEMKGIMKLYQSRMGGAGIWIEWKRDLER